MMPKTGQNTPAETLPMLRITEELHHLSINDTTVYISQYNVFLFCKSTVLLTDVEIEFHNTPQNFLQQGELSSYSLCSVYCC